MMVSRSLDELTAAADQAAARAAAARDAADQARAQDQAARQERIRAHDQAQPVYDRQQLKSDTDTAERRLTEAVKADPVWRAVIELGVCQRREILLWRAAGSVGQSPLPSGANRLDAEYLASVADREASARMEDELDARAAAREAAGEGPSR